MSKSAKVTLGLLGAVATVFLAVFWIPRVLSPTEQPAEEAVAEVVPAPAPVAEPEKAPEEPVAPVLEVVRADAQGMVVVAGEAAPGSTVEILVNDQTSQEVVAGADGTFATLLSLSDPQQENVVSLVQGDQTGDEAIIAPIVKVAQEVAAMPEAQADVPELAMPLPVIGEAALPAEGETLPDVPAVPQVLISSAEGVSLAQPAPIGMSERAGALLETISYNAEGDLLFGGRSEGAGQVFLYVDNSVIGTANIGDDGQWLFGHAGVAPGRHVLRVDRVDDAGKVTARVETPFQREAVEDLAQALVSQEGGIAQRIVQPGHTLWAIAREKYGRGIRYVEVFEANKDRIRNPDLIYPGQVFALPQLSAE